MNLRGNLEVCGPEDFPEAGTPGGPTRTLDGNEALSGIFSGGKEAEGEIERE